MPISAARDMSNARSTWWPKSSQTGQVSCGNQLCLNEVVEGPLEAVPSSAKTTSRRNVFGQSGIECAQTRSEHAAVGLGEEHGDAAAQIRQLITVLARDLRDQPFALQTAKIVLGVAIDLYTKTALESRQEAVTRLETALKTRRVPKKAVASAFVDKPGFQGKQGNET